VTEHIDHTAVAPDDRTTGPLPAPPPPPPRTARTEAFRADGAQTPASPPAAGPAPDRDRWFALGFIALAQLMVVLDATITNIALPSAQRALDISDGSRQWVITAYTLGFGGLLLLGGRLADYLGRMRMFLTGLAGFALVSALAGAAPNLPVLLTGRAVQGCFGAMLAPAALSLLSTTFTEPGERARAFGAYGAIAGGGGAVGLLLGGVLTEYLDWRWCLYVNVPIALAAAAGGARFIHAGPRPPAAGRIDVTGAALITGTLVALVYALSEVEARGWSDGLVLGLLAAALVGLGLFALAESRAPAPLLPPRIPLDRDRGGAYLAVLVVLISTFGVFLFLTYYFQVVRQLSPLRTGLAFLPMVGALLVASAGISTRLLPKVAPRVLMVPGLLFAAGAMAVLSRLSPDSGYASVALPAELLVGFGGGLVMVPAISTATIGVGPADAGVASATVNASQQIGASIGTALLNSIAIDATRSYARSHPGGPASRVAGLVHGYTVAALVAAAILAGAALVVAALVDAGRPAPATDGQAVLPAG